MNATEVMQRFNNVAGGAFVPPDWAMGTTWWRDDLRDIWNTRSANQLYGQDLVIRDADKLQEHQILVV